ncbi:MAG: ARMT1-like domain-containing protein [Eubacteriales bacterium]|nr:ARMT1-like domain-containing protein [Eubacteriales bacterium]
MNADQKCIDCCKRKALGFIKESDLSEKRKLYAQQEMEELLFNSKIMSAPELMSRILAMVGKYTGIQDSYARPKQMYNQLLLAKESAILREIHNADDPFLAGIQYAVTGNYIDFAGVQDVQESKLQELLDRRAAIELDTEELTFLKSELANAKRLLYITDNAGEIVLDKIFIHVLKEQYPNLEIAVLTREAPILNDATIQDALEIGMDRLVKVLPNGTSVPGTIVERLPAEAAAWMNTANLCISKGQGNFETLHGSSRNIYYLFLCKCQLFTEAFGVEPLTPILGNEKRISVLH